MGSCSRREGKAPAFEENTTLPSSPLFFKVVLARALQSGKLEIPMMAVMENDIGNRMENTVFLKVPNGGVWPVKLTKSREGKIYLQKGLPEFAKFYSISEGYILLFSYEGDHSSFQVLIMNTNGSEIDYPLMSSPSGEPNIGRGTGGMSTAIDRAFSRSLSSMSVSDHPFFVIKMNQSYIKLSHMKIPSRFAEEYICGIGGTRDLILQISYMRTWSLKCALSLYGTVQKKKYARFYDGWKDFVRENDLKIGDDCVFELIDGDGPKITFKVDVFRAN